MRAGWEYLTWQYQEQRDEEPINEKNVVRFLKPEISRVLGSDEDASERDSDQQKKICKRSRKEL